MESAAPATISAIEEGYIMINDKTAAECFREHKLLEEFEREVALNPVQKVKFGCTECSSDQAVATMLDVVTQNLDPENFTSLEFDAPVEKYRIDSYSLT